MSGFLFYSHLTRLPNWKVFFSRTFLWHALKESRKTTDLLNPLPPQPPPEKKLQQNERISPGNEISPRTSITKLCVWFFFFFFTFRPGNPRFNEDATLFAARHVRAGDSGWQEKTSSGTSEKVDQETPVLEVQNSTEAMHRHANLQWIGVGVALTNALCITAVRFALGQSRYERQNESRLSRCCHKRDVY